jgi:hypothetical protein
VRCAHRGSARRCSSERFPRTPRIHPSLSRSAPGHPRAAGRLRGPDPVLSAAEAAVPPAGHHDRRHRPGHAADPARAADRAARPGQLRDQRGGGASPGSEANRNLIADAGGAADVIPARPIGPPTRNHDLAATACRHRSPAVSLPAPPAGCQLAGTACRLSARRSGQYARSTGFWRRAVSCGCFPGGEGCMRHCRPIEWAPGRLSAC